MKTRGRYYVTKGSAPFGGVTRPTRNAAGMSETSDRSRHHSRPVADTNEARRRSDMMNTLRVRGTLDKLRGLSFYVERLPCPCCGARNGSTRVKLNSHGRRRLRLLRAEKGIRS